MKWIRILLAILFALLLLGSLSAQERNKGSVELRIIMPEGEYTGSLRVLLFNGKDGFPFSLRDTYRMMALMPTEQVLQTSFEELPPGRYAISVWHDEDRDFNLDKSLTGRHAECTGFSNNPRQRLFRGPSFQSCSFVVGKEGVSVTVDLRHRHHE
ncbi:hypothetical protein FUAX_14610 [Fulvitalea axinellae]|uniref:DUF2141 domain-containing protein n=1 Tax=Fulvitalea axinellae TaxID=1182444 RepID=A0AAU9CAD6_9BACT|nr:hypothetical protein FUAX_14610 [Fulvitalea axinellae]